MEYLIRIDTGNAAFDENRECELARILRSVSHTLENGRTNMTLLDINGNKVGSAKLVTKSGAPARI